MGVLECCRILLYFIEWIWTTAIMGIFPNQLTTTQELTNGETSSACLFNLHLGTSRCDFGVAWSTVAFTVLTLTMIWYSLEYCTTIQLPGNVETIIFSWLTIWWLVGAIAFTATKNGNAPSAANIPVVFSWMLFILSAISAFIGSKGQKQADYRASDTDNDEESY